MNNTIVSQCIIFVESSNCANQIVCSNDCSLQVITWIRLYVSKIWPTGGRSAFRLPSSSTRTTSVHVISIEPPTAGILSVIPCEKRDHCERLTANLCKADYIHKFSDPILTHIPLKTTADQGTVVVGCCALLSGHSDATRNMEWWGRGRFWLIFCKTTEYGTS